jgi:hypothetical protein
MGRHCRPRPPRRRTAAAGVVGAVASGIVVLVAVPLASAAAPDQQGWWTSTNPGGLPTTAPSDVPPDGLLVQGGPQAPTAYSALSYLGIGDVTAAKLTLTVAPNTLTTSGAKLQVCRLKGSFSPEQGGPSADAPAYDCNKPVSGTADANGHFSLDVTALVSGGELSVALLPSAPTDRVVLSKPDAGSLTLQVSASTAPTSTAGAGALTTSAPVAGPATTPAATTAAPVADQGAALAPPALPAAQATMTAPNAPVPVVAGSPQPATDSTEAAPITAYAADSAPAAVSSSGDSALSRALAGVLIAALVLAVALWAFAGNGARAESAASTAADGGGDAA